MKVSLPNTPLKFGGGRLGNRNLIAIKPSHCLANKSRTYLVNLPLKMVQQVGLEPTKDISNYGIFYVYGLEGHAVTAALWS